MEEESMLETALDKVEPYGFFKQTLMTMQHEQPQLYETLTKILNPDEQAVVQGVIQQADANAAAAAQVPGTNPHPQQVNGGAA